MATGGSKLMSDTIIENTCCMCREQSVTTKAENYCCECNDYYCTSCVGIHKGIPYMKGHNIRNTKGFKSLDPDRSLQSSTQRSYLAIGSDDIVATIREDVDNLNIQTGTDVNQPQRVFKLIFVGDAGVGKSCIIHRICTNQFRTVHSSTFGIDFETKILRIEGQTITLQLWDTAGQERYNSITKQFFRKADAVVAVYDVTSVMSFNNVRKWITCVQEEAQKDVVVALVGNKIDTPGYNDEKAVKRESGSGLAANYGALFYEASAFSGENVENVMEQLARRLIEKEDKQIEHSILLEAPPKKISC